MDESKSKNKNKGTKAAKSALKKVSVMGYYVGDYTRKWPKKRK